MLRFDCSGGRPSILLPILSTGGSPQIGFAVLACQVAIAASKSIKCLPIVVSSLMSIRMWITWRVICGALPLRPFLHRRLCILYYWSTWLVVPLHTWSSSGHRVGSCFPNRWRWLIVVAGSYINVIIPAACATAWCGILVASQELWDLDFGWLVHLLLRRLDLPLLWWWLSCLPLCLPYRRPCFSFLSNQTGPLHLCFPFLGPVCSCRRGGLTTCVLRLRSSLLVRCGSTHSDFAISKIMSDK